MNLRIAAAIGAVLLGATAAATVALRDATAEAPGVDLPADGFERVVRRTPRFPDRAAAQAYAATAVAHPGTALGNVGDRRPFAGGVLLTAAPCGCHRQVPQYLYVAARGTDVVWLSVEGPKVTPARVLELAATG